MHLRLDLGRALHPESKAQDSSTCMQNILQISSVISTSVPVYGFTQLGLRSHPFGSSTPEATTATLSFFRPDKPVYITASVRPIGPCQPTLACTGRTHLFLFRESPPGLSRQILKYLQMPIYLGMERPHEGFPGT